MERWSSSLDMQSLVARFGSPLYITHLGQLRSNLDALVGLVGASHRVAYPVKANPSLVILRELAALGCSADCSTPHEVTLALSAGFPVQRLVYNSSAPDRGLMAALLASGATVVADSRGILEDLGRQDGRDSWRGRLLVRVSPQQPVEYLHHVSWEDMVSHASTGSKFGIPSEDLTAILAACDLPIAGLHLHVGTQMDRLQAFLNALQLLHDLHDSISSSTRHRLTTLNLGGGLGIDFQDGQSFPSLTDYVAGLRSQLRAGIDYMVEPGHALVGNAVALLAQILEIKEMRGCRWAILNVGSDQLIKVTLLSWHHQILDRSHRILPTDGPDAIGGPLCFAGDVLLPSTRLEGQRPGDPLLIQHVGAYCFAVSNHFNGHLGPAHVTVEESGEIQPAYQREDDFADHAILGQISLGSPAPSFSPRQLDLGAVEKLSSAYLREGAAADTYRFLEVRQIAPRTLEFKVEISSPLGAVSVPMAVRVAADATIITTLHLAGKPSKDVSVWGTRSYLQSDTILRTRRPLTFTIHVTPEQRLAGVRHATHLAHWEIERGRFRGCFRLTL